MKAGRVKRRRIRNKTGYDTQLIARLWTRVLRDYKNPTTNKPLSFPLIIRFDFHLKLGDKPRPTWTSRDAHLLCPLDERPAFAMVVLMPPVVCPTVDFLGCLYYFATWGSYAISIPEFHKIAETYGYNLIDIPNRKVNHP